MFELQHSVDVNASPARVWELLSDYGALASWFADADHSRLITAAPVGVGSERRVSLDGFTLIERIVTWEPRQRLTYDVQGLPPVIKGARSDWQLEDRGDGTTRVSLTMQTVPAAGPVGALLYRVAIRKIMSGRAEALVDGLKRAVEGA